MIDTGLIDLYVFKKEQNKQTKIKKKQKNNHVSVKISD